MLIVIAVIALLLAMPLVLTLIAPRLMGTFRTKQRIAQYEVAQIAQQLGIYMADNGYTKPPTGATLAALTQGSTPYLRASDLIDPWGRPYQLVVTGANKNVFHIVSYAEDGQPGGDGQDVDVVY